MPEKFIEKGTDYPLRNGMLSVYETNCVCENIKFYFDQFVMTLMLSGHKTIETSNLRFEFFPGTLFIPEKEIINKISIPHASFDAPSKCLVLELQPDYVQSVYEDVLYSEEDSDILYQATSETKFSYYVSNDQSLVDSFIRLYEHQFTHNHEIKSLVDDLIIREILVHLFHTEGLELLKSNFEKTIADDRVRKAIAYIRNNLQHKITTEQLAKASGLGQTTLFKRFKESTGKTPIHFILKERINQAKVLIQKNRLSLQEVAYHCGFNSYEYFCSCFKKIENMKPSEYKKEYGSVKNKSLGSH